MLTFSQEDIILQYRDKKNLTGNINIKNQSNSQLFFKFKVNRPKFYLVKPDRGIILPSQSITISFTLHRDGISQVLNDKFKCFHTPITDGLDVESMSGFEDRPGTNKHKLMVKVINLPSGIDMVSHHENKGSQVRSIGASQYQSTLKGTRNTSTLESLMKQKQERVSSLQKQIENIQNQKRFNTTPNLKDKGSSLGMSVGVLAVGFVIGVISSLWI